MGESDRKETWNSKSSLSFVKMTNISAFCSLHSTPPVHEVLKLLIAKGWGLQAGKVYELHVFLQHLLLATDRNRMQT